MKLRHRLAYTHEHTLMNWALVTEVPIKDVECKFRTGNRTDPPATLSTLVIIESAQNLSTKDINVHACIAINKGLLRPSLSDFIGCLYIKGMNLHAFRYVNNCSV